MACSMLIRILLPLLSLKHIVCQHGHWRLGMRKFFLAIAAVFVCVSFAHAFIMTDMVERLTDVTPSLGPDTLLLFGLGMSGLAFLKHLRRPE